MIVNVLVIIALVLSIFVSVVAWLNTQIILRDMSEIKMKLGIKQEKSPSFLDKDLDNE